MKCTSRDSVHYKCIKDCWKQARAQAPPQSEGHWDLIHSGCFWNTISRSNICQRMMHDSPVWHHSCCHSSVYSKARRSTVVQINFTISPHPPLSWRLNIDSWVTGPEQVLSCHLLRSEARAVRNSEMMFPYWCVTLDPVRHCWESTSQNSVVMLAGWDFVIRVVIFVGNIDVWVFVTFT